MIIKSIRWRLQAWHGLILVVVLLAFGLAAFHAARNDQLRRVDRELDQRMMALGRPQGPGPMPGQLPGQPPGAGPEAAPSPPPAQPEGEPRPDPAEFLQQMQHAIQRGGGLDPYDTNVCYYILWQNDGSVLARSPGAPANVPKPERPSLPPPRMQPDLPSGAPGQPETAPPGPPPFLPGRTRGELREMFRFLPQGECVLAGRSIAPELAAMQRLAYWLTAAGAAVLALGLAGGSWLAARAIHPIKDISATAVKIAGGDLAQRINVADTESELGRLAGVLNSTFARLEAAFAQQARFTADASHELRTPVSVILTQTQTALSRPRTEPEYREALEACQRAAQRMRKLTASLLELARLDAGQEPLKRETFDLAQVARESVELVRPLAAERGVEIAGDFAPAPCQGDPERLAQVATNLLTNAIQAHGESGEGPAASGERGARKREGGGPAKQVRISTRVENGAAVLVVADTGSGIPAEDLPHIFERFFRVDKSRAGGQGHTGLGLAICQAIVDSHGGAMEVQSEPGKGSVFMVKVPVTGGHPG